MCCDWVEVFGGVVCWVLMFTSAVTLRWTVSTDRLNKKSSSIDRKLSLFLSSNSVENYHIDDIQSKITISLLSTDPLNGRCLLKDDTNKEKLTLNLG